MQIFPKKWVIVPVIAVTLTLGLWQATIAGGEAPQPNPLAPVPAGNPIFAPVAGVDITANGAAASIHGDPGRGRVLFAQNCVTCHNDRGLGGVSNPGSDDGTVPPLNPIDPGFIEDSQADPAAFARDVDLFVQHGSRPSGDDPQLSMIGWGDHKLLTQQQLADVEAYVMQLNGVYWPDRWAPPAEVRVVASQNGNRVTYQITLVNHGSSTLTGLVLKDTLPTGLSYVTSYTPGPGQNAGKLTGTTVEWDNSDGVPQGGTLGPFVIEAEAQAPTAPPNVAQLFFVFATWDGTTQSASAVSEPSVPGKPKTAKPFSLTPAVPTAAAAPATATPVPQTMNATPTPTSAAAAAASPAQATPTPVPPTATPAPATATPVPAAPAPAVLSVQIVQPSAGALSWGYSPPSITIHVGDSLTWTNVGSLAHTVTADDGSFDSGSLSSGDTWTFTFNTPGTYSYHCTPHPWMKGTVVVQSSGQ